VSNVVQEVHAISGGDILIVDSLVEQTNNQFVDERISKTADLAASNVVVISIVIEFADGEPCTNDGVSGRSSLEETAVGYLKGEGVNVKISHNVISDLTLFSGERVNVEKIEDLTERQVERLLTLSNEDSSVTTSRDVYAVDESSGISFILSSGTESLLSSIIERLLESFFRSSSLNGLSETTRGYEVHLVVLEPVSSALRSSGDRTNKLQRYGDVLQIGTSTNRKGDTLVNDSAVRSRSTIILVRISDFSYSSSTQTISVEKLEGHVSYRVSIVVDVNLEKMAVAEGEVVRSTERILERVRIHQQSGELVSSSFVASEHVEVGDIGTRNLRSTWSL